MPSIPLSYISDRPPASERLGDTGSWVPELESLRGAGVIAIVAFHLWPGGFFFGWSRVDLFFVISGYLITSMCLRRQQTPNWLAVFYGRRALRTWPAYYGLVIAVFAYQCWQGAGVNAHQIVAYSTFTQNLSCYWSDRPPAPNRMLEHTWCLALEEQFYLVWPVCVQLFQRRRLAALAAGVALGSLLARLGGLHPWLLAARCDGLAMGAILAVLLREGAGGPGRLIATRVILTACATGGLSYIGWFLRSGADPGVTFSAPLSATSSFALMAANLFYCGLVGLVICFSGHPFLWPLRVQWIRRLGRISYGVFLFHYPVIVTYASAFSGGDPLFILDLNVSVVCLGIGALSYVFVEQPLLKLRPRWSRATGAGERLGHV